MTTPLPKRRRKKKFTRKSGWEDGKSPLGGCNRACLSGFKTYFSQRPGHFRDIYKVDYSDQTAYQAYRESNPDNLNRFTR
jgi:hypothetical protein